MGVSLKPVDEQVIVITGADSGIGLATARLAARRGACLVLNSRNEPELARIAAELRRQHDAQVEWHCADVADMRGMLETAEVAIRAFGRIDTWINNAGVSIYGMIEDVPLDDARRVFETNYWGVVNGSLAALPYLKANGGALINVGSILSDTYVPLQGHYTASKHAVKGFTDALRLELMHQKAPVSVTLVKPGAIDTPYPQHAANFMDAEPKHPHPVYVPEVVARAILHCAAHPRRSVTVGGGGRVMALTGKDAPALNDVMGQGMFTQQKRRDQPSIPHENTLWEPPARTGRVRGDQPGYIMKHSAYTAATLHPVRTGLALAGIALGWAVATGAAGGLLNRGRALVDNLRGGDGMSDDDVAVTVRTQPAYAAPLPEATVVIREEVYVLDDAALGDRYMP
ncbi:MAG TPA: SDR family oxidoreductase [Longimicrobium sp.]|nr:SDR family oxidoreductase [Longimicrobium sp.]